MVNPSDKLEDSKRKNISKNVKALFFHRIGSIVLSGTDSLIMSAFLGMIELGKYSNYLLIITFLNSVIAMCLTSIKGSVGNSISLNNEEQNLKLFNKLNYVYFWIISFCSIAFFVFVNPFIKVFFGANLVFDVWTVAVIAINFFLYNIRQLLNVFKDCRGLFWENRFAPIIESLINLAVSIVLVRYLGVAGVLVGTIISNIFVPLWNEPYVLNKHYFKKSNIKYMLRIAGYFVLSIIVGLATYFVCSFIPDGTIWWLLVKACICVIIPNILLLLVLCWLPEFKECIKWAKSIIINIFGKGQKVVDSTQESLNNDSRSDK